MAGPKTDASNVQAPLDDLAGGKRLRLVGQNGFRWQHCPQICFVVGRRLQREQLF
jgi:hypothetical protein